MIEAAIDARSRNLRRCLNSSHLETIARCGCSHYMPFILHERVIQMISINPTDIVSADSDWLIVDSIPRLSVTQSRPVLLLSLLSILVCIAG